MEICVTKTIYLRSTSLEWKCLKQNKKRCDQKWFPIAKFSDCTITPNILLEKLETFEQIGSSKTFKFYLIVMDSLINSKIFKNPSLYLKLLKGFQKIFIFFATLNHKKRKYRFLRIKIWYPIFWGKEYSNVRSPTQG